LISYKESLERRIASECNRLKEELETVKREHSKSEEIRNQQLAKLREASNRLEQLHEKL